jgi:acetoacetyl-CoA synthetase
MGLSDLRNIGQLAKVCNYMKENQEFLWTPNQRDAANSHLTQFRLYVNQVWSLSLPDYFALHAWSIAYPERFWESCSQFLGVMFAEPPQAIMIPGAKMQDTQWFKGAKLNFAQSLLRGYQKQKIALISRCESGTEQALTYPELYQQVGALAKWLREAGVTAGDRVAGWLPNGPVAVIAMLAAASLGAIWSACSCDFGLEGVLDRFSQIRPKILLAAEAHTYGGKIFQHLADIHLLQKQLPGVEHTIIVPFSESQPNLRSCERPAHLWQDCLSIPASIEFVQLPFNHPLYILYSSGTTGKPKCIVHGAGGTLLQHLKELILHTDLRQQDTIFFYTTCAWMMWHWTISSLSTGATIVLYEGNPFYPQKTTLFDLIDECGVSVFGAGARFFESAEKSRLKPRQSHSLDKLRTILTTGSPLLPESFDYIYRDVKSNLQVSSISGGSDIISCFALGNPVLPVYRGELQCLGLGMDVKIFNEQGQELAEEKGELVCATAFPSMPIYFWNDTSGEKYQHAYFDRFPSVWAHGDYAQLTSHGGLIIYGRSDATLNPGGIRIGTAEIYQQLEKFPEILDCLAVGYMPDGNERIILFITLAKDIQLSDDLMTSIKTAIRTNASPHHVPAQIIQAPDLPRTLNGKLMEIAVKKVINGQPLSQTEGLANPQSLEFFKSLNLARLVR